MLLNTSQKLYKTARHQQETAASAPTLVSLITLKLRSTGNKKTIGMADHFIEIKIPQQRNYNNINNSSPFPSVLSPNPATTATVSRLAEKVRTQKPFLDSLLLKAGSVLFRGFDDVKTAKEFNDVVEAFGYEELPYVGGAAPRTNIVGRVFTANESPPDQKIPFHHEMAQVCGFIYLFILVVNSVF